MTEKHYSAARSQNRLENHHDSDTLPTGYGPRMLLASAEMFPGSNAFITYTEIGEVSENLEVPVAPHRHDADQYYLLLSAEPGSLELEFTIDDDVFIAQSPGTVRIPAGSLHAVRLKHGPGTFVMILLDGEYR